MKLLPDTLLGRLTAAIVAVVGAMLLVIVVLIVRERAEWAYRTGDVAEIVAGIATASRDLAAHPLKTRGEFLDEIQARLYEFGWRDTAGGPPAGPSATERGARRYERRLRAELGDGYRISAEPSRPGTRDVLRTVARRTPVPEPGRSPDAGPRPGPAPGPSPGPGPDPGQSRNLDITVSLPDGYDVVFRVPVPGSSPPMPRRIFGELGLLVAAILIVLFVMTRSITRPLSRLAAAAEAVGRGELQEPLEETGARELREATRSFNVMQERLHRYIDSRTRVAAAMSHDLRTPLTRLRLRAERIGDPELRERFIADADEMNRMVTSSLNLFRGLNDREKKEQTDVNALLAELRDEYAETGQYVDVSGSADAPILLRRHALKRCLSNLLANALTFGQHAAIEVDGDAAQLVIRIVDDGPGLPEDALDTVFEPFFRLEGSRNRDTGGTGLGLSIARDVAQAHGGSLVLRNREPHGLVAELSLPRGPATGA